MREKSYSNTATSTVGLTVKPEHDLAQIMITWLNRHDSLSFSLLYVVCFLLSYFVSKGGGGEGEGGGGGEDRNEGVGRWLQIQQAPQWVACQQFLRSMEASAQYLVTLYMLYFIYYSAPFA